MNEFQGTTVIIALFALRCVMPLMLMLALGYGMKRLVRHWDEGTGQPQTYPAVPLPMVAMPMAAMPMAAHPTSESPKSPLPCWILNNCDEKTRDTCPAYISPLLVCWVARLRADGQVPARCAGCALYTGTPSFAAGD